MRYKPYLIRLVIIIMAMLTFSQVVFAQQLGFVLSAVRDGTAPFDATSGDGYDASDNNDVVRTLDTMSYVVEARVSQSGDTNVRFEATFPAGLEMSLPNVCLQTGVTPPSTIVGDSTTGYNIVCNIGNRPTGSSEITFNAKVLVDDGTPATAQNYSNNDTFTVEFTNMTSDNAQNPNPATLTETTTVSAGPRFDLRSDLGSVSGVFGNYQTLDNGTNGRVFRVPIALQIDPASGGKGSEPLTSPITTELDLSSISPGARLFQGTDFAIDPNRGCGYNRQNVGTVNGNVNMRILNLPNGRGGGTRDVTDGGDYNCTVNGNIVTLTITGADTTGNHTPTLNSSGSAAAAPGLVSTGFVNVWIPVADVPSGGSGQFTVDWYDFDPDSISGVSNYGATCTRPGANPGDPRIDAGDDDQDEDSNADLQNCENVENNDRTFTMTLPPQGTGAPGGYINKDINAYPSGGLPGNAGVPEGSRVVVPNQLTRGYMWVTNGNSGNINNLILCDKIDTNHFVLFDDGNPTSSGSIEYYDGISQVNIYGGGAHPQQTAANWAANFVLEYTTDAWGSLNGDNCAGGNWFPYSSLSAGQSGVDNPQTPAIENYTRYPNVTGVRIRGINAAYDNGLAPSSTTSAVYFRLGLNLQVRSDSPLDPAGQFPPNGRNLCNYWTYGFTYDHDSDGTAETIWRGDGTNDNANGNNFDRDVGGFDCDNYRRANWGERVIVSQASASLEKYTGATGTAETENILVGDDAYFRLDPVLNQTVDIGVPVRTTLVITDTLPEGLTFVEAQDTSGNPYPITPTVNALPGGGTELVFDFGNNFLVGTPIEDIVIRATVEDGLLNNTTLVNTAVIEASAAASPLRTRQDTSSVNVTNPAAFIIRKIVNETLINPDDTVTYELRYNNTGSTQITEVDIIDILPNLVAPLQPTNFDGNYEFVSIRSDQAANIAYYVTTRPYNEVNLDPDDASNEPVNAPTANATIWCQYDGATDTGTGPITITGGNTNCPATINRADVNATRVIDTNLFVRTDPGRILTLVVDSSNNQDGNVYTNEFGTRAAPLAQFVQSNDVTTRVVLNDISGYVYVDSTDDDVLTTGEPPIAGVTITLTGTDSSGNSVNLTTTTDANGFYIFRDLRAPDANGYTITQTQPALYPTDVQNPGTTGGNGSVTNVISGVGLTPGTDSENNNFGEQSVGVLAINKTTTTPVRQRGQQATYLLTIENPGTETVVVTQVTDTFNASAFQYQSARIITVTDQGTTGDTTFTTGVISGADEALNSPTLTLFGSSNYNLGRGDSIVIELTMTVLDTAADGTYDNTATVSDNNNNTVTDDGVTDGDGNSGRDQEPDEDIYIGSPDTPGSSNPGPSIFDPPFGRKVVDPNGLPVLQWTMVWFNPTPITATNVVVSDVIPPATTYRSGPGGSAQPLCTAYGASTVTRCEYDPVTNAIIYEGSIAGTPVGGNINNTRVEITYILDADLRLVPDVCSITNTGVFSSSNQPSNSTSTTLNVDIDACPNNGNGGDLLSGIQQLPATGETPLWRTLLNGLAVVMSLLIVGMLSLRVLRRYRQ